jgi:hypothetical protein
MDFESFQMWFKDWVRLKILQGEDIRT